jgi:hypothetical protein
LDDFEGLQGLWTDGGGGWDFRPDRFFFFGKNQGKGLKLNNEDLILSKIWLLSGVSRLNSHNL